MIEVNRGSVSTIILNAELMMYGYLAIRISNEDNETIVTWFGMADGGEVVANAQKKFYDLDWALFIDTICDLELPLTENDRLSILWGLQLGDKEDELIYELAGGLWDRELIEQIINVIEEFLGDPESVEIFRHLFEWA